MRTARKLLLGETWFLPVGIAVLIVLAAIAAQLEPAGWRDAGGPALLAGVVVLIVAAVARER